MIRAIRFGIGLLCAFLLVMALLPGSVSAQDANTCQVLVQDVIAAAQKACATPGSNTVCYGHETLQATGSTTLTASGQQADLTTVTALKTSAASPDKGDWGVAVMDIQGVRAVLFGDASLTSAVRPDAANWPTLPVKVLDPDLPVTLRAGASPNLPLVARLVAGQDAVVDGRNAKGNWVRVRLGVFVGWTALDQVDVTGDPQTLTVLDDLDIMPAHLYTAPMQAFTLSSAPSNKACAEASAGLLLQLSGDKVVHLLANGVDVSFYSATLLLHAAPNDYLEVMMLAGGAEVRSFGTDVDLAAGDRVRVRLSGKDKLTASATPRQKDTYAFSEIGRAPVALLPTALPCTVGVTAGNARVVARSGPGAKEYTSLFYLQSTAVYPVVGWAPDSAQARWWKLQTDAAKSSTEAWVDQSQVQTVGACDRVAQVEPGAVTAGGGSSGGGAPSGFAPTARTIWNVKVGADQLVGQCSTGSLNYCDHLAAISPSGSGVLWKGQEIKTFFLGRVRENVYAYSGRNGVGDGSIKMVLTFLSPTSLTLTQTVILDSEPTCQHVYTFTASVR